MCWWNKSSLYSRKAYYFQFSWDWVRPHLFHPYPANLRACCLSFRNFISTLFATPQENSQSTRPNLFLLCIHRKHDPIKRTKKTNESSVTRGKHAQTYSQFTPSHGLYGTSHTRSWLGLAPSSWHCPPTAWGNSEQEISHTLTTERALTEVQGKTKFISHKHEHKIVGCYLNHPVC